MTAVTLTLTDFLLARIAEDERGAKAVIAWAESRSRKARTGAPSICITSLPDHLAVAPSRVLAECEAKRRIIAEHEIGTHGIRVQVPDIGFGCTTCDTTTHGDEVYLSGWCPTLKLLAAPYADHPDYREEWKP